MHTHKCILEIRLTFFMLISFVHCMREHIVLFEKNNNNNNKKKFFSVHYIININNILVFLIEIMKFKTIKCLCNDDLECAQNDDADQMRWCSTDTVCLTTKFRKRNGTEYFKYRCDRSLKNSVKLEIIQFRHCLTETSNVYDLEIAKKSPEYCCNSTDFCNRELKPESYTQDPRDYFLEQISNQNEIPNSNNLNSPLISLVMLSFFFSFILLTLVFVFCFYLRNKKKKLNNKTSQSLLKKNYSNNQKVKNPQEHEQNQQHTKIESVTYISTSTSSSNSTATTLMNSKENTFTCYDWSGSSEADQPDLASHLLDQQDPRTGQNDNLAVAFSIPDTIRTSSGIANNCNEYEWSGSGSGAGMPQLLQRTIARQIKLVYPCIGKGRFGEVYKGMWRDEFVAVKTFNSTDEKSWQNECNIYNTNGFRHENILGFIAADNIDRGTYTELWIITEFHKNGSLFDFLNENTITTFECLRMAISIVNGLDHLHTPIESCTGKPALAHCDLKSKNILVKSDLTCCIGDLGLALCGDKQGNVIFQNRSSENIGSFFIEPNNKVIRTGTKRYMAPEILNRLIDVKSVYQFQNAEMYSLGLIFWEMLRRVKFEFLNMVYVHDYELPYQQFIPMDPDESQMKEIVCEKKLRPGIIPIWKQINVMSELSELTEELWAENSHSRLNALRLKKSLNALMRQYY